MGSKRVTDLTLSAPVAVAAGCDNQRG